MRGSQEFASVALAMSVALSGYVYSAALHHDVLAPFTKAMAETAYRGPTPASLAQAQSRTRTVGVPAGVPPIEPRGVPAAPILADVAVETTFTPDQLRAVQARLQSRIPPALLVHFDLYLYVSKAAEGPWAQHLFVFHRDDDGTLAYEDSWPVSTGRERHEKYFTDTPSGLFELDPDRFEPMHISHTWHGAKMPWSMFLNYRRGERMAGIALHAAIGADEDAHLGQRASGGCVRLPLDRADALYHRIQAEEGGMVPVFAFDEARGTTSVSGEVEMDENGNVALAAGYKVLLVIDDYPGEATPQLVSQNSLDSVRAPRRLALEKLNQMAVPERDKGLCFG